MRASPRERKFTCARHQTVTCAIDVFPFTLIRVMIVVVTMFVVMIILVAIVAVVKVARS